MADRPLILPASSGEEGRASCLRAACLTPAGSGGVAVVRLAGPRALAELAPHLRHHRDDRPATLSPESPWKLILARLMDGEELIDECLVCCTPGPRGEVIDLNLHGGPRVVERALMILQRLGANVVPGLDLLDPAADGPAGIQAAALRAIPDAKTPEVVRWLLGLPARLGSRLRAVIDLIREARLVDARAELEALCRDAERARLLLRGVRVVLTGPPNAGKSTLANALSGQHGALVSDQPGTTRDWTEHHTSLEGVPLVFVDTAGVRGPADEIEREAIARGRHQAAGSDILLVVLDASTGDQTAAADPAVSTHPRHLVVWNKSDLAGPPAGPPAPGERPLAVSAAKPSGLEALRTAVLELVGLEDPRHWPAAPLTLEHQAECGKAMALLSATPADPATAQTRLADLTGGS